MGVLLTPPLLPLLSGNLSQRHATNGSARSPSSKTPSSSLSSSCTGTSRAGKPPSRSPRSLRCEEGRKRGFEACAARTSGGWSCSWYCSGGSLAAGAEADCERCNFFSFFSWAARRPAPGSCLGGIDGTTWWAL